MAGRESPDGPVAPILTLNLEKIGSGGRDRTYDQLINSQLLYH